MVQIQAVETDGLPAPLKDGDGVQVGVTRKVDIRLPSRPIYSNLLDHGVDSDQQVVIREVFLPAGWGDRARRIGAAPSVGVVSG